MNAANGGSLDEIENWPFSSDTGQAVPWRWDQHAVPERVVTNYQATQHNVPEKQRHPSVTRKMQQPWLQAHQLLRLLTLNYKLGHMCHAKRFT